MLFLSRDVDAEECYRIFGQNGDVLLYSCVDVWYGAAFDSVSLVEIQNRVWGGCCFLLIWQINDLFSLVPVRRWFDFHQTKFVPAPRL